MSARAGESARKTGDFKCDKCGNSMHVTQGDKIPACSKCGNDTFSERTNEPSNPSTQKK